jgi:hypothetical protein
MVPSITVCGPAENGRSREEAEAEEPAVKKKAASIKKNPVHMRSMEEAEEEAEEERVLLSRRTHRTTWRREEGREGGERGRGGSRE